MARPFACTTTPTESERASKQALRLREEVEEVVGHNHTHTHTPRPSQSVCLLRVSGCALHGSGLSPLFSSLSKHDPTHTTAPPCVHVHACEKSRGSAWTATTPSYLVHAQQTTCSRTRPPREDSLPRVSVAGQPASQDAKARSRTFIVVFDATAPVSNLALSPPPLPPPSPRPPSYHGGQSQQAL